MTKCSCLAKPINHAALLGTVVFKVPNKLLLKIPPLRPPMVLHIRDRINGVVSPALAEHNMPCLNKQKPTDLDLHCLSLNM